MTALEELCDEALVERYVSSQRRDEAVFKELFRRHREGVWRVCFAFLGNPEDAEDLTQQVFFTAHRKLHLFRRQASLKTWLHRVAANSCKNELRRRSRRPEGFAVELPEEGTLMSRAASAEQELIAQRRVDRLGLALGKLGETEQRILQLAEFEGRPYADIGAVLGLSLGAVKMRVMRARLALKRAYREVEQGGELE